MGKIGSLGMGKVIRKLTLNIESGRYLMHREKIKDNEIVDIKGNTSLKMAKKIFFIPIRP